MISSLQSLYDQTLYIAEHIQEASYEELVELADFRTEIVNKLQQTQVSEEMKAVIRLIGEYDDTILKRMQELKDEAATSLNKIKLHRMQKQKYEQAYNAESYFVDLRE
ncbi:hypothetical protein [Paenibacillus sp. FSL H8-0537]|uniref:hypothetical protein n=1 Tax=Paenibacillus sp. FSL H8-0537 TaxID=2921399 RepID=UPI003100F8CB